MAAGVIHKDFEKGFIRAETISYDDFIAYKGEAERKKRERYALKVRIISFKMAMCCIFASMSSVFSNKRY
ncbi:DUF933 domain-containing protein [Helicobacter pylori]